MMRLFVGSSGRLRAALVAVVLVSLVLVAASAGAPPTIEQKQAEAQHVLAQVQALDVQFGRTVEAWNGARYELGKLRVQERRNAAALAFARHEYQVAERRAGQRAVAVYESDQPTAADAVLGAATLSDILDRLELVHSATQLDHRIARRLTQTRETLSHRAAELDADRRKQSATVAFLAQRRASITSDLARRKQLLAGIQDEVRKLQAAEAARQLRLQAEARARVAAEQRRIELERERQQALAAKAAAAAKQKKPAPADPPPPTAPTSTTPTTTTEPTTTTSSTTTTTASTPPPPPAGLPPGHPEAASIALRYLGVPYRWGGSTPSGFDCSGLVMYVYRQIGIALPHFAAAQFAYGTAVPRSQLQAGDLVFFDNLNHVGISLGGNQFVDAPQTGDVVKVETLSGWYASTYVGARRL